jgi:hypothetical protein
LTQFHFILIKPWKRTRSRWRTNRKMIKLWCIASASQQQLYIFGLICLNVYVSLIIFINEGTFAGAMAYGFIVGWTVCIGFAYIPFIFFRDRHERKFRYGLGFLHISLVGEVPLLVAGYLRFLVHCPNYCRYAAGNVFT